MDPEETLFCLEQIADHPIVDRTLSLMEEQVVGPVVFRPEAEAALRDALDEFLGSAVTVRASLGGSETPAVISAGHGTTTTHS